MALLVQRLFLLLQKFIQPRATFFTRDNWFIWLHSIEPNSFSSSLGKNARVKQLDFLGLIFQSLISMLTDFQLFELGSLEVSTTDSFQLLPIKRWKAEPFGVIVNSGTALLLN